MDFEFQKNWRETCKKASELLGWEETLDVASLLFLIGVQELGQGYREFKKDEKVNLMHVAICTLLSPFGYYELTGRDQDDWPHFDKKKELPPLSSADQDRLIKEAIIQYFENL
jgi:hypothetical protein